jgi:TonB family protein
MSNSTPDSKTATRTARSAKLKAKLAGMQAGVGSKADALKAMAAGKAGPAAPAPALPLSSTAAMPKMTGWGGEYLGDKYFTLTIAAAIGLHFAGLYAWQLMPHTQVIDIPVRALSIKLGDGEPLALEDQPPAISPDADNKSLVENALAKAAQDNSAAEQARDKSVLGSMEKAMNSTGESASKALEKAMALPTAEANALAESARKLSNIARQFVRTNAMQAPGSKGSGSTLGNSTAKEAEMMSRYEQLISLWIEKFKKYPDEARQDGIQGETVVRIRIDRQGNIRYHILERSTGHAILDKAAIDMVKRANPVPAVPNDYPPGDLIEFLIPVNFRLQ